MPANAIAYRTWFGRSAVAVSVALLTLLLILSQSRLAVAVLILDGLCAAALVVAAVFAGTLALPLFSLERLALRWRLLLGSGIGLGALSTLVLVLGTMGLLGRGFWMVIMVVIGVLAVVGWDRLGRDPSLALRARNSPEADSVGGFRWLWMLVVPFLAVTLLVSTIPPGFLWAEEGAGYDVLEYHLGLPKEYLQQGSIDYTPHNVYGGFPANAEMLYLLCMVLRGDPFAGAATAKILNALLAMLCVFAAYAAGRELSPRVGVVTGVVAASVGWFTYLSGVAYVENAMLLFGMIAAACLVRGAERTADAPAARGWTSLSGAMVGLACGCKYSAVLLIALPLGVMVLLSPRRGWASRFRAIGVFAWAALLAFSPWLIKNVVMTGDPVFPLGYSVFGAHADGWGLSEARHFSEAHAPGTEDSSAASRLRLSWQRVPGDPLQRFGPLIFLLAAARLLSTHRRRLDWLLLCVLIVQAVAWTFATHLFARFAVPMIIPLVLLAGRAGACWTTDRARRLFVCVVVVGVGVSALTTARLYAAHLYPNGVKLPLEGLGDLLLEGHVGGHEHLAVINESLDDDARILMIGDAKAFYFRRAVDYHVVFNRNPFVEIVRDSADLRSVMAWIRRNRYTHVLVNWAEVRRLRNSRYGFSSRIDPPLFESLSRVGLSRTHVFSTGDPPRPYAELFAVEP